MNRKAATVITAIVLTLFAYIVVGSMARVETRCEICLEYNGIRRCAKGAGATIDEAKQGAQTAICGVLANGMNETIQCQNVRPVTESCST